MNNIRFGCHKCGQRLACEPPSLGTRIQCPACKQSILVPTLEILQSYELLDLGLRAPFDEVKQAHLERVKAYHPDRFTDDPQSKQAAVEKARDLNKALETITSYLTGTYAESRPAAKPKQEPRTPPPEAKSAAPAEKRAESKPAPPQTAARPFTRTVETGSPIRWVLIAAGAAIVLIGAVVWLVISMMQRPGSTLTDDSTGTQWTQAKEAAKRAYCHAILVEMEQKGVLRQYGVRGNEQLFYDGLQALCRQKDSEDLNSRLFDLSTKVVSSQR
jgi:hypothetical protein